MRLQVIVSAFSRACMGVRFLASRMRLNRVGINTRIHVSRKSNLCIALLILLIPFGTDLYPNVIERAPPFMDVS